MTTSLIEQATEPAECSDCIEHGGFCRSCIRDIVPKAAIPPWLKMIGDGYTCDGKVCGQGEHLVCLESPELNAPRGGCECHSCGQRRGALKHQRKAAKEAAKADPIVARKHDRQKRAAVRRNERKVVKARKSPTERLRHHLAGGFDRSRPMRSVA